MRALQTGMMEKLTESIAPAFLRRNISSFTTFMVNYSALDTSHQVLDQLFTRSCHPPSIPRDALIASLTSGGISPYSSQEGRAQDHLKNAISSLVETCLDPLQDFWELLHYPCFSMKLASLHLSLPGSGLQGHAYLLQVQLEHPRPIEAELEGEATAVLEDKLQSVQRFQLCLSQVP
ncbi:ral guanine nucleotide dissociation stimulator-like [Diceros bicornis minor]|uniref:ral guanine nucleotide dissociation stimulator-like n=1 Tax=Diceros bicornis minor TaxID=77932 RepID=UPI0026F0D762|nr:ral guanine nucleotide dissociation stimulator-like [Diceros bicornis minor]